MKKAVLIVALFMALFPLQAQWNPFEKKRVREENLELRKKLDSLAVLIDSLRKQKDSLEASLIALPEDTVRLAENAAVQEDTPTMEATDSLIDLWYRRVYDNSRIEEYDMDSVKFSSNVPDSVITKRLAAMNSFITIPFNSTVKNYIVLYSEKAPKKMSRILGLSAYYMPIFEEAFARYSLPLELKYMAVIESNLNPVAMSRVGARGMWQFMYGTAKVYGLKINSFVDERLDVEKAVDAAARYLRDSYEVFGDWNLAISSYNCGAGNVQKAIRRAGSRDFWAVYEYLPRETRGYVPAFVGAMYAMTYSREYGIVPEDVGMPAVTDTFEIHRNLHFKQIHEVIGVPYKTLKDLNPQYVHDIIPGNEGKYILKLPFSWSAPFMAVPVDTLCAHKSGELLSPQIMKNIRESGSETRIAYKVRSGDYLGRIAARYHVSVSQIKRWNHLRSDRLRVGQIIYIYRRGPAATLPSDTAASSGKASSASGTGKGTAAVKADSPKTGTATAKADADTQKTGAGSEQWKGYTTYTVRQGDTLYSIAKQYPGVSAQNIIDYNSLGGTKIRPGMKIRIPSK